MYSNNSNLVVINKLKRIYVEGGDVLHCLKSSDKVFQEFGEAYFSFIEMNYIKAWKRHIKMTMNLIVPIGTVQFVFYSPDKNFIMSPKIGEDNYCRITVSPGVWFGFKGLAKDKSCIINISNIIHDPFETEKMPLNFLNFRES